MKKNKETSAIEKIKLQLEKKLLEIEKRKKEEADSKKVIKSTKKEEKTLFELRKELQELQKNNTEKIEEVSMEQESPMTSSINSKILDKNKVKETVSKTNLEAISNTKYDKADKITKEKTITNIPKKATKNISSTIKKENTAKKSITTPKETTKRANSTHKAKEGTMARNKIIFIIAFAFALLYLGYLYKLKVDLNKEKEALEKKKQEQIDYTKKDAVFKEVEEDPAPEELQDIK